MPRLHTLLVIATAAGMTRPAQPADYTAPDHDEPGSWPCQPGRGGNAGAIDLNATLLLAQTKMATLCMPLSTGSRPAFQSCMIWLDEP